MRFHAFLFPACQLVNGWWKGEGVAGSWVFRYTVDTQLPWASMRSFNCLHGRKMISQQTVAIQLGRSAGEFCVKLTSSMKNGGSFAAMAGGLGVAS